MPSLASYDVSFVHATSWPFTNTERFVRVLHAFIVAARWYQRPAYNGYVALAACPVEVLVAVTDGILERRDLKGEFFGLERLKAVVQANRALSAESLLERIFAEAEAFGASRSWDDDATVVVVKRLAEG